MATEKKVTNRKFWDRYARFYDAEVLRFSGEAYADMYARMAKVLTKEMRVLEVATGTGLIALNIAEHVNAVVATDFSPKMIAAAQKKIAPRNVSFSVEDGTELSFVSNRFDAAIISNTLHIMPDPAAVLGEIRRVLKPDGLLIAPTFSHGHLKGFKSKLNAFILKLVGFKTQSKWAPEEFVAMIVENGFCVKDWSVLEAAFPLVYLEARLAE